MANRSLTDSEIVARIPAARKREARERRQGLRAVSARYQRATRRVVLELANGYSSRCPSRPFARSAGARSRRLAPPELIRHLGPTRADRAEEPYLQATNWRSSRRSPR